MVKLSVVLLAGPEFLRHELNNRFLQSQADRVPNGMSASQLMHYESHQHHHQHLHQHQHQHQHFHSNGAPLSTPQVPQSVVSAAHMQSRSQSFVPLDQRSVNESSGSIHFEITKGNNRILVIRFTAQSQCAFMGCYGACLKWMLPELSFSDRWSKGTELWERDWLACYSNLLVAFGVVSVDNMSIVCRKWSLRPEDMRQQWVI